MQPYDRQCLAGHHTWSGAIAGPEASFLSPRPIELAGRGRVVVLRLNTGFEVLTVNRCMREQVKGKVSSFASEGIRCEQHGMFRGR